MPLVRLAPKVLAALAALVPTYLTWSVLEKDLNNEGREILGQPMVKMLIAYGVAYGATGNLEATLASLVLVVAVFQQMEVKGVTLEKYFSTPEKQDDTAL